MKINRIQGREVFDSQGLPTLACDIFLESGEHVTASVPAGTSVGAKEARELRDGGERLFGYGVMQAAELINTTIAPLFVGKEINALEMDAELVQLDPSSDKSQYGANTLLAVSTALYKAHALASGVAEFDFIAQVLGDESMSLPMPLFNVLSGGAHVENSISVQEYLLIPIGAESMLRAMQVSMEVYHTLKTLLEKDARELCVGMEGGYGVQFENMYQPLDYIMNAIQEAGYDRTMFAIGMDVAASQLYNPETKTYTWFGKQKTADQLISAYEELSQVYPLIYLEDGLHEDDWSGWKKLMAQLGSKLYIVGDDLVASNVEHVSHAIELPACNAVLAKPNQVGTISELLEMIVMSRQYGMNIVASHRSRDTEDSFLADLAVGIGARFIKAGGGARGERMAKYNRLLYIAHENSKFSFFSF